MKIPNFIIFPVMFLGGVVVANVAIMLTDSITHLNPYHFMIIMLVFFAAMFMGFVFDVISFFIESRRTKEV